MAMDKSLLEFYHEKRLVRTKPYYQCRQCVTADHEGVFLQWEFWQYYRQDVNFKGKPVTIVGTGMWLATDHTMKWMELIHG